MIFNLANNVTSTQFGNSTHFVYAHISGESVYIGLAKEPAKRWNEHYNAAFNTLDRDSTAPLKKAIKSGMKFEHFILGAFNSESEAREFEACAIQKFSTLNSRPEFVTKHIKMVDKIISQGVVSCVQKNRTKNVYSVGDRKLAFARVIEERNRLRLVSTGNDGIPSGLKIECSRAERAKYKHGDLVKVMVVLSEKPNGTKYLSANKTAPILPM